MTDDIFVQARPDPQLAHFFVDRGPQFPKGAPEADVKLMPAQVYNIALHKAGERVSDYLRGRGLPGVADCAEAQKAIPRYAGDPWFDELDTLFASSIHELALPGQKSFPRPSRSAERSPTSGSRWRSNIDL